MRKHVQRGLETWQSRIADLSPVSWILALPNQNGTHQRAGWVARVPVRCHCTFCPALDFLSSGGGWWRLIFVLNGSGIPRIPGKGGHGAQRVRGVRGVPSRRRCVAAAGTRSGRVGRGGRGRRAGKGTLRPCTRTRCPGVCPLGLDLQPLPWLARSSSEISPRPTRSPPFPAGPPAPPTLETEGGDLGAGACGAGARGRVGGARRNLGLLGEGAVSLPQPGGELGEGAGQGRKRAGAVFVAALPSGTDGWGGERVRGGRRRGAGAGG